jgi:cytochrome c553
MHPITQRILLLVLVVVAGAAGVAMSAPEDPAAAARRELAAIVRLKPDPRQGEALFHACGTCHESRDLSLPKGWVPRIAGQHASVIAKQLLDYRHGLRWDTRMEAVARQHLLASDQQVADLAAYARRARRTASAVGSGEHTREGQVLYLARCGACHGPDGIGSNLRVVPELGGQDYDYLLRQLHDAVEGRRPSLTTTHARLLMRMDADQLEGLADYLSRLQPSEGAEPAGEMTAWR